MKLFFIVVSIFCAVNCIAQQVIPLYTQVPNAIADPSFIEKSDTAKGRIRVSRVTVPTLTAFFPAKEKATGTAVIICPGGGYSYLVMNSEGIDVAEAFIKKGIAAFVLKYRLPNDKIIKDKTIGPLQDAQQAIKILRQQAKEWNIDSSKIGIMGFSAGGHVAVTASTHFDDKVLPGASGINLRPDFSILVYPVISFADSLAHKGSRRALLGADSIKMADLYSGEKQVTAKTPPAFLILAGDDKVVPAGNSISYYQALLKNGVKAELHIYPTGGHGFGLHNATVTDNWLDRCFNWMASNKWIKAE